MIVVIDNTAGQTQLFIDDVAVETSACPVVMLRQGEQAADRALRRAVPGGGNALHPAVPRCRAWAGVPRLATRPSTAEQRGETDAPAPGRQAGVTRVHAHRFRHTFATWAIENQARELDVQYLLGHSTPDMVRRYSATYNSEKAARAHEGFSPADRLGERIAEGAPAIRLA
jgi:hypothetical protein